MARAGTANGCYVCAAETALDHDTVRDAMGEMGASTGGGAQDRAEGAGTTDGTLWRAVGAVAFRIDKGITNKGWMYASLRVFYASSCRSAPHWIRREDVDHQISYLECHTPLTLD